VVGGLSSIWWKRLLSLKHSLLNVRGLQVTNSGCPQGGIANPWQETWQLAVQPEMVLNLPSACFLAKGRGKPSQLGMPDESLSSALSSWQVA